MRLSDIVKQCKDAGATSVELYPDGAIKSMTFGTNAPIEKKKLTRDEEIEADKKKRNPRRNAMDVALEVHSDLRSETVGKA